MTVFSLLFPVWILLGGIFWSFLSRYFLFLCYRYNTHLLFLLISVFLQDSVVAGLIWPTHPPGPVLNIIYELAGSPVWFACCICVSQKVALSSPYLAVLAYSFMI